MDADDLILVSVVASASGETNHLLTVRTTAEVVWEAVEVPPTSAAF